MSEFHKVYVLGSDGDLHVFSIGNEHDLTHEDAFKKYYNEHFEDIFGEEYDEIQGYGFNFIDHTVTANTVDALTQQMANATINPPPIRRVRRFRLPVDDNVSLSMNERLQLLHRNFKGVAFSAVKAGGRPIRGETFESYFQKHRDAIYLHYDSWEQKYLKLTPDGEHQYDVNDCRRNMAHYYTRYLNCQTLMAKYNVILNDGFTIEEQDVTDYRLRIRAPEEHGYINLTPNQDTNQDTNDDTNQDTNV